MNIIKRILGTILTMIILTGCSSMKKAIKRTTNMFVHGYADEDFAEVKAEFVKNFTERGEIGAACCIYYNGKKVVDLWGGYKNHKTKELWQENTIVRVYSTTKGMALLVLAKLHSDGLLDYNEKVSTYWPEFAKNGKENITVEQLITHKGGLVLLDRSVKVSELDNYDELSKLLENAKPMWTPGKKHGYHSATIGLFMQQLVRRIDKKGRTIGQYFSEEIAEPLDIDFYIGLPYDIDTNRLATMKMFLPPMALFNLHKLPKGMWKQVLNPFSLLWKSMLLIKCDINDPIEELKFEEVSGGGAGEARALAKVYGILATGGRELNISTETMNILIKYTVPPDDGIRDQVMGWESLGSSAGYTKPYEIFNFAGDSAFGFSGTGGSLAYADPEYKVGYAYVMNKMDYYNINDPREIALREAMYKCIKKIELKE